MIIFRFLSRLKKSRSNIEKLTDSTRDDSNKNKSLETARKSPAANDNEIDNEQQPETENTKEGSEDAVFIFQESLPEKDESIICSSVLKCFELIKNDDVIMPGFGISPYLEKSYFRPNSLPNLVSHVKNNLKKVMPIVQDLIHKGSRVLV